MYDNVITGASPSQPLPTSNPNAPQVTQEIVIGLLAQKSLSVDEADTVVNYLKGLDQGALEKFAEDSAGKLGADQLRDLFINAAKTLDGAGLARLSDAYRKADTDHVLGLANEIATHASDRTKVDYIGAIAQGTRLTDDPERRGGGLTFTPTRNRTDLEAQAVGRVLASLKGDWAYNGFLRLSDVKDGFSRLNDAQHQAVFIAAADVAKTTTVNIFGGASPESVTANTAEFSALMKTVATINAPGSAGSKGKDGYVDLPAMSAQQTTSNFRGRVVAGSVEALDRMQKEGVGDDQLGKMARDALGALDGKSVAWLTPNEMAKLAGMLAKGPKEGAVDAMQALARMERSDARDAFIRTLFLKMDPAIYAGDAAKTSTISNALARSLTDDAAQSQSLAAEIGKTLATPEGRDLLSNQNVGANARLTALFSVAENPQGMRDAITRRTGNNEIEAVWENKEIIEPRAQARVDQFSAVRGNAQVTLSGGSDFANFVGAALGAPMRSDLPQDPQAAQAEAASGKYDFYDGVKVVQDIAGGLSAAQRQLSAAGELEPVNVSVLPVQFSSRETGPVDLLIYRVEGVNGQSRYVDNTGRVYESFNAWTKENTLPSGKMTYPAGGVLSENGPTKLATENTPNFPDTPGEKFVSALDTIALAGGIVASGVLIVGTFGAATPIVVATATGVALFSSTYAGVRAGFDLADRYQHDQTLSVADPDARAAWLSLGGSALSVVGPGAMAGARFAGRGTNMAKNLSAVGAIAKTSSAYADAAATLDTGRTLIADWRNLTPGERVQMGLNIAFWGATTRASARMRGERVADAFDYRTQIQQAMISTGAAVSSKATLEGDAVAIKRNPDTGKISIEYGPNASPESTRIHQDVAQLIVASDSYAARLERFLTGNKLDAPGTAASESKFEVLKLSREIEQLGVDLSKPNLTDAQRSNAQHRLDFLQSELGRHEADLARAVQAKGLGIVEVPNTRRVPPSLDPTLNPGEVTLKRTAPGKYEAAYAAGVKENDQTVLFFRQVGSVLSGSDRSLEARSAQARKTAGAITPGSALERAERFVATRGDAADALVRRLADNKVAPNQASRLRIAQQALHDHQQNGIKANLFYEAIEADPARAQKSPQEVVNELKLEAVAGRLSGSQISDMARVGWLNEADAGAARAAAGVSGEQIFKTIPDLNRAARQAEPFMKYTLELRAGNNEQARSYTWTTDQLGRPREVTGVLLKQPAGRQESLQARIGNEIGFVTGLPKLVNGAHARTDVGFHLVPDPHSGPTNNVNVVPGSGALNNSRWKTQFENRIKDAEAAGHKVEFRIALKYGSDISRRPAGFETQYRVDNGLWSNLVAFPNR